MKEFLLYLFLVIVIPLKADTTGDFRRVKILPVPTFGYSPEARAYAGFVALSSIDWYHDSSTRISNAKIELTYTRNRQFIAETGWNFFTKGEIWFSQGLFHASRYPDSYFGIGYFNNSISSISYESTRIKAETQLLKAIKRNWFLGPTLRFAQFGQLKGDSIQKYSELHPEFFMGGGVTILRDKRDNLLNARKGHYLMFNASGQKSRYQHYLKLTLDSRYYTTYRDKITLALRLFQQVNISEPVFFDHAVAGGDAFVRGYFYGKYRNRQLSFIQSELRTSPYKRVGMAVFGGYSCLFNQQFKMQNLNLYNYGVGLRILADKNQNINLRIDYARGVNNQYGFYFAFGEAF